jgi:hypothetical protein
MPEKRSSLDIVSGVPAIAECVYGSREPYYVRRTRHLIAKGLIPVRKVAGRVESRKCWLEAIWAEPDQLDGAST